MDFYYPSTINFIDNTNISNCSLHKKPRIEKTDKNINRRKKHITQKVLNKK